MMWRRGVGEGEVLSGISDRLAHCDDKVRDGSPVKILVVWSFMVWPALAMARCCHVGRVGGSHA